MVSAGLVFVVLCCVVVWWRFFVCLFVCFVEMEGIRTGGVGVRSFVCSFVRSFVRVLPVFRSVETKVPVRGNKNNTR